MNYTAIEAYPLALDAVKLLNFYKELEIPQSEFLKFHEAPWNTAISLSENFTLPKKQSLFETDTYNEAFDIIFFDSF